MRSKVTAVSLTSLCNLLCRISSRIRSHIRKGLNLVYQGPRGICLMKKNPEVENLVSEPLKWYSIATFLPRFAKVRGTHLSTKFGKKVKSSLSNFTSQRCIFYMRDFSSVKRQCCGIGMFYPGSGSENFFITDTDP
jgi:hypothetical protein